MNKSSYMRSGWTVIELIFIIVIIGILASIALIKIGATRDDASLSADVSNMAVCIKDMNALYISTGTPLTSIDTYSCNNVQCYTMDVNISTMTVDLNLSAPGFCENIQNVGGHLVGSYQFAGESVTY